MLTFVALNGLMTGQRFAISLDRVTIGRTGCDVTIDLGAVSRRHAVITREDEAYFLADLESRSGTYLNDLRIHEPRRLTHGDQIRICQLLLRVEFGTPSRSTGRIAPRMRSCSVIGRLPF